MFQRLPRFVRILSTCAVAVAFTAPTFAEDGESERPWSNEAELGFVATTGNSETETFKFGNVFIYNWTRTELEIKASALRAEQTNRTVENVDGELIVTEDTEKTAEAYSLNGTLRQDINERLYAYGSLGWERNRFQGIDNRYRVGAGLGYTFIEDDRQKLRGELGGTYTDEERVAGTIPADDTYAGARAFGEYELQITDNSKFTQSLEFLQNLDESDDLLITSVTGISANISKQLALKVSYTVLYDGDPVVELIEDSNVPDGEEPDEAVRFEFDDTDTILAASLVITF